MTGEYHYFKNPQADDESEKHPGLHPRLVKSQKVTMKDIARRICNDSTFTEADTLGVLLAVKERIIDELIKGNHVFWEDFGTFHISLKSIPTTDPAEMIPTRVKVKKIYFRPTRETKIRLRELRLERTKLRPKESTMSPTERRNNILRYLKIHGTVQSGTCRTFNGCSRSTASKDLRWLLKEGLIRQLGSKESAIYVLPENKQP